MSTSFEFDEVDRFIAAVVGEPGSRVFYLQISRDATVVTLQLEKQQLIALCDQLNRVLADQPDTGTTSPVEAELVEPVVAEWLVGSMGFAVEDDPGAIMLVIDELGEDDTDLASARIRLTPDQARQFVGHGREAISGGRPSWRPAETRSTNPLLRGSRHPSLPLKG